MNSKVALATVSLLVGVLVGFALPGAARTGWMGPYRSGNPVSGITGSGIDGHFIEQMIPHHDGAIAMSELALERAQRAEVRELARAIIDAQTRENAQMRAWYKSWFGTEAPSSGGREVARGGMMSGSGMHMGGGDDLEALRAASDFDRAFIEQMVPHHQMAIMMARMLSRGTTRPEMAEFAQQIIEAQSGEIEQMRSWYAAWY